MYVLYFGQTQIVPPLYVRVYLDNYLRSDIYCLSVNLSAGTTGSTSNFVIPPALWDNNQRLLGKQIRVDVNYKDNATKTLFFGWIDTINRDAASQELSLSAKSLLGFSDDFYIANGDARYPKYIYKEGIETKTNWTPKTIIQDWLSASLPSWRLGGNNIPSQYRALLKTGDMSVFDSYYNEISMDDIEFKSRTFRDAMDDILNLLQNIQVKERFVNNQTYLDFFELGYNSRYKNVWIAPNADASTFNTNVFTLSKTETIDDSKDRIKVVGDRLKYIVTFELIKDWDESLEADVLANPTGEITQGKVGYNQTQKEYWEKRSKVFRKYKLPDVFKNYEIDDDLPLTNTNGDKLPILIFRPQYIPVFDDENQEWVSVLGDTPEILDGVDFDKNSLTVTLDAPNVYFENGYVNELNKPVEIYAENTIFMTICYNNGRLIYDTGKRNSEINLFRSLEREQVILASGFRYIQYGNVDDDIGVQYESCTVYNEVDGWLTINDSVNINDEQDMITYAEIALQDQNRKKESYTIETPFLTWAYDIGDSIKVNGDNSYTQLSQIQSITYNLTNDHSTQITTDTSLQSMAVNILKQDISGV
jgi:hypothetical protein